MKLKVIISIISINVSGCSSVGLKHADNGLLYYFPEKCNKYRYSESHPNELQCLYNGELTGIFVYPVSAERMLEYKEKVRYQSNYSDSNNNNSEKVISCKKFGDFSGQVYQFTNRCPLGYSRLE